MSRFRTLLYNITFFLACLLLFLLIFENQLAIPTWLQVGGRMHPLMLHFPIAILILYGLWVLAAPQSREEATYQVWADDILLLGTFTAVVTSLMGLLLSQESGYDGDTLFWHKWLGVSVAYLSFGWYSFRSQLSPYRLPTRILSGSMVIILLVAGHLGANITHGEEFLLAPIQSIDDAPVVAMEDALVYEHVVQPILQEKCMTCHNPQKAKGELVMTTTELLAKGGKSGVPWDTTETDLGLLLRRVHLSMDDKKHMPPRGKVQLTEDEIQILESWIRNGSSFTARVQDFPKEDPLFHFASNRLRQSPETESYDFAAADEQTIRELNTNYRVIIPLAEGSPALSVHFYSTAAFRSSDLSDLSPIQEQIVELDASKMPVKDQDLKTIARFSNLQKLILNFTDITGATLNELSELPRLRYLSLTGTPVTAAQVRQLAKAPSLRTIYAWNTKIQPGEFSQLRKEMAAVNFVAGYRSDTVVLKLNPPLIETKEQILIGKTPVKLKHQIPGTSIRYTLDGTEPDSASSPLYKGGILIEEDAQLRARAYKPGWYGSDVVSQKYYRASFRPDSVLLLTTPAPQYNGKQGKVLADGDKGNGNFKSGKWVGIQTQPLTALLSFQKPVQARRIALSMLQNVGASIFPPVRVEVWGGMKPDQLKLLGIQKPSLPTVDKPDNGEKLFEFSFDAQSVQYVKVVAVPLARLPGWHTSKGEPAWVFMDEVLFN